MFDYQSTVVVFREIIVQNELFFQWYRIGEQDEDRIMPIEPLLSADEHWQRFNNLCS